MTMPDARRANDYCLAGSQMTMNDARRANDNCLTCEAQMTIA